jgi:uncharacterized protein YqhQ
MGGFDEQSLWFHLIDGILKFAFFLAYISGIGLIPDIRRVYAYHGAEHKAIHVFEANLPFNPIEAEAFPAWHPRCGTAFIFLALALSILFFALIFPLVFHLEFPNRFFRFFLGLGLKIFLMLPLSGLAYEITRLAGRPNPGRFWSTLVWPGLLLQRLTTRNPDHSQLEVAFTSLKNVLEDQSSSLNNQKVNSTTLPCTTI